VFPGSWPVYEPVPGTDTLFTAALQQLTPETLGLCRCQLYSWIDYSTKWRGLTFCGYQDQIESFANPVPKKIDKRS
jgi:hypothetical protein